MIQVQHVLRIASTIACAIVIGAFVMWASDEGQTGSQQQVARISESDGGTIANANKPVVAVAATAPQAEHGGVRGAIENANEALVSPFDHVGQTGGPWAAHMFPALLALLTYGLLARILIAYLPR
jgi:hypothetical protein